MCFVHRISGTEPFTSTKPIKRKQAKIKSELSNSMKIIPSPSQKGLFLFVGDATRPIPEIIWDADGARTFQLAEGKLASSRLIVLHLNDLHGQLLHFSRIAGRIREVRSHYQDDSNTAILVMSAGDDMIGSLFDELLGSDPDSFSLHAVYRLYSAVGMDVCVLGNHDVDLGTDVLACGIRQDARFPILSANLKNCQWLEDLCHPAALFITKGIRVGIIGLTAPAETRQPLNSKLEIVGPVFVVQNLLPAMRPLCDVIIILSHLGYSQDTIVSGAGKWVGDVELAQSLPHGSVDLIVGGHTHHVLNKERLCAENIVNGIPIVQAGSFGEFLGQVDISLQNNLVSVTNANLIPTETLPVDREFEEKEIQPLIARVRNIESRTLGRVEDDPQLGTDAVKRDFALGELAFANFITDGMVAQLRQAGHTVDFAMTDASSLMCGIPFRKELSFGDWFKVMPFADTVRLYQITGQELNDLLQNNVARMDCPNEEHRERGFLQFSKEIRYTIDVDEKSAKNIEVNGIPLTEQLDALFTVATSIFTRELAGKWEVDRQQRTGISVMKLQNLPHTKTDIFLRKMLVAYIQGQGGVTRASGAKLDGRLRVVENTSF